MQLIVKHKNNIISNTKVDQLPKVGDAIGIEGVAYYVTSTNMDVKNFYLVEVLSANEALTILEQISESGIVKLIKCGTFD